ncbi:MAG TPA: tetratricopeptide repeat protein [Lacunisphaera sp.]|nr:tetratricopeptide repeat protein [Lacunisphaera sp.]
MSQLPPADQSPQSAAPVYEPGFEAAIHDFWMKNRNLVLMLCGVALLAIMAREGWEYYAAGHERDVQAEYAKLTGRTDQLAAFAAANPGHALAGVAYLQVADEKFSNADYKAAAASYQQAAGNLKNEALLGRAKLGLAMSQLNGGDRTAGEAALKALGTDQSLPKNVRAEATYHLASLAAEAGKTAEVKKLVDDVSKIDATGSWSRRATMLLASQPAVAKPAEVPDSGISFKPIISDKPPGK